MEHQGGSPKHDGMPPWIPRVIVLVVLAFLGTYLLVWSVIRLRGFLLALVAVALRLLRARAGCRLPCQAGTGAADWPPVWYSRRPSSWPVVVFAAVTLPPMVTESASLVSNVPGWLADLSALLNERFGLNLNLSNVSAGMIDLQGSFQTYAASVASGVLGVGAQAVNLLLQLFTMALFTFYLLADGPRFRRLVLSLVRPERQAEVSRIWEIAIRKTGGYVYSRALLALISAIFTYVFLLIVGVPYALPLAVWVGVVSQFIPAVGTYLAALVPVLVALTVRPDHRGGGDRRAGGLPADREHRPLSTYHRPHDVAPSRGGVRIGAGRYLAPRGRRHPGGPSRHRDHPGVHLHLHRAAPRGRGTPRCGP